MAFSDDRWGSLAQTPKMRLFSYDASNGDDTTTTDYFAPKWQELYVNDVIYIETSATVVPYKVTAIGPSTVTIQAA